MGRQVVALALAVILTFENKDWACMVGQIRGPLFVRGARNISTPRVIQPGEHLLSYDDVFLSEMTDVFCEPELWKLCLGFVERSPLKT
jgi:hypothetical protein